MWPVPVGGLSESPTSVFLWVWLRGLQEGEVWVLLGTLGSAKNLVSLLLISQLCFAGYGRNVGGEKRHCKCITTPGKLACNILHNESFSKDLRLREVGSGAPEQLKLSFRERLRNQWQLMWRSPCLYCSCNRILIQMILHCFSLETGSPLGQKTHTVFKYKP